MSKKAATQEEQEFIARVVKAIEYKRKSTPDLTDEMIAEAIGTERPTVTNYQSHRPMPRRHISKFCEYTGVNERWLISGKGGMEIEYVERIEAMLADYAAKFRSGIEGS